MGGNNAGNNNQNRSENQPDFGANFGAQKGPENKKQFLWIFGNGAGSAHKLGVFARPVSEKTREINSTNSMKHTTKNPIGRPRNAGPDVLPIFDSMKACQGACGVPIHIQKRAKAAGCPAFRAGRIYLSDLLKWLFARDADDGVDWDRRWKRARAEREELKLKQEKGEVISRGHRVEQLNEVLRKLRAIADEAIPDRKAFYDFCKRAQDLGDIFDT